MSNTSPLDRLVPAIRDLEACLRLRNIPHVTIGAVAVCLVARARDTNDIDALIWVDRSEWESLLSAAADHGFVSRISDPIKFAERARVLLFTHTLTQIQVDLSLGALPFEQEAIERARTVDVSGLTLRVSTPEDLIVMKALAGRPRDIADIESIMSVTDSLDVDRIRKWVREFAELLERPEILQRLESMLQAKP